ncbi:hypothetical protein [Staphylococcus borealis]|uniref:hypothetical protein n=1 Tax=Staphylococcus borealis TaxID=2742203 RepID=UPI002DB680B0|nr:hypothetical protein [Staphylococcus borealis]MEB7365398.1 hypothetical protein [Staphylococcus borealis]MEB7366968.1 hypothetical protein [Staphylococcus borealis]
MLQRLKKPQVDTLNYLNKNLNQKQYNFKSHINEYIKENKLSYAEINEVLYLIDREQQYFANHRS